MRYFRPPSLSLLRNTQTPGSSRSCSVMSEQRSPRFLFFRQSSARNGWSTCWAACTSGWRRARPCRWLRALSAWRGISEVGLCSPNEHPGSKWLAPYIFLWYKMKGTANAQCMVGAREWIARARDLGVEKGCAETEAKACQRLAEQVWPPLG